MGQRLEKSPGQDFLANLAGQPADSFESRFALHSTGLGLGFKLDRNELTLLYEAALSGEGCRLAINDGRAGSNEEARRRKLEWDFMVACDIFYASPGWQNLPVVEQESVQQMFLTVAVADEKLAW